MTSSMTGFARRDRDAGFGTLSCEIRSVNHRYLELAVRLPDALRPLEPSIRDRIAADLKRGKIDCSLRLEVREEAEALVLNGPLVDALCHAAASLDRRGNVAPLRAIDILRWPNVLSREPVDADAAWALVKGLVADTLADLVTQRSREGLRLDGFLRERLGDARRQVARVWEIAPLLVPEFRERLQSRLAELAVVADPGRLEQELALFAQRSDVTEELDRLSAHLDEVERLLQVAGPVGRKLDFMMQELNREANTLSSKASDLRLTGPAVELKVFIEQMREQIQNIE